MREVIPVYFCCCLLLDHICFFCTDQRTLFSLALHFCFYILSLTFGETAMYMYICIFVYLPVYIHIYIESLLFWLVGTVLLSSSHCMSEWTIV